MKKSGIRLFLLVCVLSLFIVKSYFRTMHDDESEARNEEDTAHIAKVRVSVRVRNEEDTARIIKFGVDSLGMMTLIL